MSDELRRYEGEEISYIYPKGTYIIGTKYRDGDPGDAWGVGFYLESYTLKGRSTRHRMIDNEGQYIYGPKGFAVIKGPLQIDVGHWLVANKGVFEASPPLSINIINMLNHAFEEEE